MRPETLEEMQKPEAMTPLRALILEDSSDDVELLLLYLRRNGFSVTHHVAENRKEFLAALMDKSFDVVLSDYALPGWTGLDAAKEMRSMGKDTPVLLVTGTLGEEAAVECIKNGVTDYILKDNLKRLPSALTRALAERALRDQNAKSEDALRASEARNRDLVENSVYGIFRVATGGYFLDANPALLRILGCSSEQELKNLNLDRDIFRFPEQHSQCMEQCRQQGQIHGVEAEWRRRDGGFVTVRLNLRRLSIPGCPGALEIIAEDVTELRAMERQLRQAQKFEAIGQLAGGIAHDFNNVVGAILGWAELGFDQNRGNPQVADRFGRIREQAERAAALTRELLAFARRQTLQPRAVDLNSVASGLVSFLDKVIGKDIEFKLLNATLDPVKADATQLEQSVDEFVLECARCHARRRKVGGGNGDGGTG